MKRFKSIGMESSSFNVLGTPKRVVLASLDNNNGSPISPMANLKLLTKVATSYMDENSHASERVHPQKVKRTPVKNQRQLRSLGYICKKFLDLYSLNIPRGHFKQISLGNLTVLLNIEKRRVYDIINIIASLRYASKVCKDKYSWFGNQYLISTLCELRSLAFNRNYHLILQKCLNSNVSLDIYKNQYDISIESASENDDSQIFDDNRIGALCQKSMMLFLIAPKGEPLNFRIISHIILPRDVQDKTGMRRLYDISNVLESLGLIRRCDSKHMKKPTFIYSGPELPTDGADVLPASDTKLTDIEHLSDTSSDGCEPKIPSIFDYVTTEIRELEKFTQAKQDAPMSPTMTAKKQLFSDSNDKAVSCFIKAPQSSFKFSSAGLVKINAGEKRFGQTRKFDTQTILTAAGPNGSSIDNRVSDKAYSTVIRVNKIARPLNFYKLSSAQNSIQNGGVYRAIKQGNIINLVQLKYA